MHVERVFRSCVEWMLDVGWHGQKEQHAMLVGQHAATIRKFVGCFVFLYIQVSNTENVAGYSSTKLSCVRVFVSVTV